MNKRLKSLYTKTVIIQTKPDSTASQESKALKALRQAVRNKAFVFCWGTGPSYTPSFPFKYLSQGELQKFCVFQDYSKRSPSTITQVVLHRDALTILTIFSLGIPFHTSCQVYICRHKNLCEKQIPFTYSSSDCKDDTTKKHGLLDLFLNQFCAYLTIIFQ